MYLEQGEQAAADELLADICAPNASDMFAKIGQLTRQLHTSLHDFQLDSRIPDLAMQEIPDARERLNYVITMTDKAANRTMDAVDAGLPLASQRKGARPACILTISGRKAPRASLPSSICAPSGG